MGLHTSELSTINAKILILNGHIIIRRTLATSKEC